MRSQFNTQPQIPSSVLVRIARGTLNLTLAASLVSIPHVTRADGIPSQLQGEWFYGRISSIQYQDRNTGQSAQPNGSSDRFKLTPMVTMSVPDYFKLAPMVALLTYLFKKKARSK